jgi:hypothetical protein
MLLTLVVALGIAIGWGFVSLWSGIVITQARGARAVNEALYVRVDGEPFIFRTHPGRPAEARTLQGKHAAVDQQLLLHPQYVPAPGTYLLGTALDWTRRMTAASDGGAPAIYWYLVHDGRTNGSAYGIGFHASTKHVIGYFGRKGFTDRLPPREEWFPIEGSNGLATATVATAYGEPAASTSHQMAVVANRQLWLFDLQARTVKAVARTNGPATLGQAWRTLEEVPDTPGLRQMSATSWVENKLLLRERERVTLVDPKSGDARVYPLPEDISSNYFGAFELADGRLLIAAQTNPDAVDNMVNYSLVWLDPQGNVNEQKSLRLATYTASSRTEAVLGYLAMAPFPVAVALFSLLAQAVAIQQGRAESFVDAFPQVLEFMWPAVLIVTVIGLIAAVAAYRRQQRFALPHGLAWAVFNFLFGVPGWLAYRFHRVWPPMTPCPACHQPSPRDRVACSQCGAAFPPPVRKGIEVYA